MTDLEELKRIALAATPGPWRPDGFMEGYRVVALPLSIVVVADCETQEDRRFIAAFNPSVALDLLHRLEVAERAAEQAVNDRREAVRRKRVTQNKLKELRCDTNR